MTVVRERDKDKEIRYVRNREREDLENRKEKR